MRRRDEVEPHLVFSTDCAGWVKGDGLAHDADTFERRVPMRIRKEVGALLLAAALLLAVGCSGSGPADLLSTAELEEVQDNPDHARELYSEIVRRYPDSAEATRARQRLAALAKPKAAAQGPEGGSSTQ
jgi:hypothetical protein